MPDFRGDFTFPVHRYSDRSTQSNRRLSPFWPAPLTIPAHCPVRTPTNRPLCESSFTCGLEYPPQVILFGQKSPTSTWYTNRGWFGVRLLRAVNFCLKGLMKVLAVPKSGPKLQEKLTLAGFKQGQKSAKNLPKICQKSAKNLPKKRPKKRPKIPQKKGQKKGQKSAKKKAKNPPKKGPKNPPKKGPKVPEKCLRLHI